MAEEGGAAPPAMEEMEISRDDRGPRRSGPQQDTPEFTHFLPLPKPAHLIYIKPTVAVVAGMSSRNSVGGRAWRPWAGMGKGKGGCAGAVRYSNVLCRCNVQA